MKIKNGHNIDPYVYCLKSPIFVRLLGLLGLAVTLLLIYGFYRFFKLSIWYWIIFAPIAAIFIFKKIVRYSIQMFYPKFDVEKHEKFIEDFWKKNKEPSVDIFLPWAGESIEVYSQILQGVKEIDYKNKKVYILDDKGSAEVKALAEKYGYDYLSRPNKGEFRKAGNLQYGYDHSDGEFVLILDADFMPQADILKFTIPYIVTDKKIGILQTPQYFEQSGSLHKKNAIEFGAGNVVEDFYKIDLPCRDRFKAAMCVGTSAVYRKKAIEKAGGTPKVEGTEDVRQGFKIWSVGYYVKYLPLVLSMGKTPDNYQSYFRQHNRWCSGSLVALTSEYFRKAKLTPLARIIYITNIAYYLSEALSIIFSFHLLALLFFHDESLSIVNVLWFVPNLIFIRLIIPSTRINKVRIGTRLAAFSNIFTYFYSVPRTPFKGMLQWLPAGVNMSKIQKEYNTAINIGLFFALLYTMLFIFIIATKPYILGNYNTYLVLFWALYFVIGYAIFLYLTTRYIKNVRMPEIRQMKGNHKLFKLSLLNTRSYLMPTLILVLVIVAGINSRVELSDPKAPTVVAVKSIRDIGDEQVAERERKEDTIVGVVMSAITAYDKDVEVLGVTAEDQVYSFIAEEDDTLITLVQKAIDRYKSENKIELSLAGMFFMKINLMKDLDYKEVNEGDVVKFDEVRIRELHMKSLSPVVFGSNSV